MKDKAPLPREVDDKLVPVTWRKAVYANAASGARRGRSQALTMYFLFLELRHEVEIHRMTGRVIG